MPAERAVSRAMPAGKQRVRTGCMKCRKRRRKCDERKPRCQNCEAKGFFCEYRIDLSFVQSSNAATTSADDRPGDRAVQTYSSIKFIINDGVDGSLSEKRGSAELHLRAPPHAAALEIQEEANATHDLAAVEPRLGHVSTHSSSALAAFELIQHPIGISPSAEAPQDIVSVTNISRAAAISPNGIAHSRPGAEKPVDDDAELGILTYETGLLRHYRYNVAPWIDAGDPECSFGTTVMLEAKEHPSLMKAVLALAACHRARLLQENGPDAERGTKYAIDARNESDMPEEHIHRLKSTLLMIHDLFSLSPEHWRNTLSQYLNTTRITWPTTQPERCRDEPGCWLHFRVDLAAALIASGPPLMPFHSITHNHDPTFNGYEHQRPPGSPKAAFQQALVLLARCLSMCFSLQTQAYSEAGEAEQFALQTISSSDWTSLWSSCLEWYHHRPVELQQIVDIRGPEVDQIDAQRSSSFPILIYTTPLALIANAIYHITSFLLVANKPRLLKIVNGPRSYSSKMWHSQSIAGIASAVDSPDQWDPILVSGLIMVARDLTHKSQQTSVLDMLRRVSTTTGMDTTREIDMLKRGWSMADYDGEGAG